MASISTDALGNRRLCFSRDKEKREAIRLGKIPLKVAEGIKTKVEAIIAYLRANLPMDGMIAEWLAGVDDRLYTNLVKRGLVPARAKREVTTLASFVDDYISKHLKWKPNSVKNHKAARRWLVEYFGGSRDVRSITEGDAADWRLHLGNHLSENTLRRLCGFARQYFLAMEQRNFITKNPFGSMKNIVVKGNPDRFFFVTRQTAEQVMKALPDACWKLIFALARYAGFRTPSEHSVLCWSDIDWKAGRIICNSPKTGRRLLPLFPELVPHLKAMPRHSDKVFGFDGNINLSQQFKRYLKLAGITPWPKVFQNLRSTRETELMEQYPAHVVCAWIGNTEIVARKHYLQVTDEHFRNATLSIYASAVA